MNTITLTVSVIIIVFGILQIILFFKLWGMTNNVKKISNKLNSKISWEDQAQIELLKGNKVKAHELYKETFFIEIMEQYEKAKNWDTPGNYNVEYPRIISRYSQLKEVIDFAKYDSYDKIEELLNK